MCRGETRVEHRLIWKRLPRNLRRSLLVWVTQAITLRPTQVLDGFSGPFIVVGYLRTCSGLGASARLCYEAMRSNGVAVAGIDLSAPMMQSEDMTDFEFEDGSHLEGTGTLILHINAPWVPFALWLLGRRLVRGKWIVGYWHWELPEVPKIWRIGYRFVHEVWVPSRFVAQALLKGGFDKPLRIVHHPVALSVPCTKAVVKKIDANRRFTVLVIFNMASGFTRKNPLAAVKAFSSAFGDNPSTRLIIKVSNSQLYKAGFKSLLSAIEGFNNIELVTRRFSAEEMNALYEMSDVVLSLHRSEGFGLVIAEAMLRGLPVIATDWSGNLDFLNSSNGMPVRWTPVPVADPQGVYDLGELSWADPDIHDASTKLISLRADPHLRSTLGRQALEDAAFFFGVKRYVNAIACTVRAPPALR